MLRSEALTAISKQMTKDRVRCEAMGFALDHSEVLWDNEAIVLRGRFRCVCGRFENFNFRIAIEPDALDPARLLREHGAFGAKHLSADGYDASEIRSILQKGADHDLACS